MRFHNNLNYLIMRATSQILHQKKMTLVRNLMNKFLIGNYKSSQAKILLRIRPLKDTKLRTNNKSSK